MTASHGRIRAAHRTIRIMFRPVGRVIAFLLVLAMGTMGLTVSTASAAAERPAEGNLPITSTLSPGTKSIPAAVAHNTIYAKPASIAALAGATVSVEAGAWEFERNGYKVSVDQATGIANAYCITCAAKVFDTQPMVGPQIVTASGTAMIPLERTLYLLNAGWTVNGGKVFVIAPEDTLWGILSEFSGLVSEAPDLRNLLSGTKGDDYDGNAFGDTAVFLFGSMADQIDWRLLMEPFAWAKVLPSSVHEKRIKEAYRDLMTDDAAIVNTDEAKTRLGKDLADLVVPDMPDEVGFAETTVGEAITGFIPRWNKMDAASQRLVLTELDLPAADDYRKTTMNEAFAESAIDGVKNLTDYIDYMLTLLQAAERVQNMTDSYFDQLDSMAHVDESLFGSDTVSTSWVKQLKDLAPVVRNESTDDATVAASTAVEKLTDHYAQDILDAGLKGVPALKVWNYALDAIQITSSTMKSAFDAADNGVEAMTMHDIARLSIDNTMNAVADANGKDARTIDDIRRIRSSTLLFARATVRYYDLLYSVKFANYEFTNAKAIATIKDHAGKEWDGLKEQDRAGKTREEWTDAKVDADFRANWNGQRWADRALNAQKIAIRLANAEAYEGNLLLKADFSNLYNNDRNEEPLREKIPLGMVGAAGAATSGRVSSGTTQSPSPPTAPCGPGGRTSHTSRKAATKGTGRRRSTWTD